MIEHDANSVKEKSIFEFIAKDSKNAEEDEEEAEKIEKLGETIDYENGLKVDKKNIDFTSFKRLKNVAQVIFHGSIPRKKA